MAWTINDLKKPGVRGLLSNRTSPAARIAPKPVVPIAVDTKNQAPFNVDTVEGRLNNLLSKDNPYIKTARANAAEASNQRGLLNTSIAAGTGEKAAIESAFPIAAQDASTANAFRQNEQAFNYNAALQNASAANTLKQREQAYEYDLALQNANAADILEQNKQAYKYNTALQNANAADILRQKEQAFNYDTQMQSQLFEYNEALGQMNIDADLKASTSESLRLLAQQNMTERTNILTSPELNTETKTTMLNELNDYTTQNMALVAELAGYDVSMFDESAGHSASDESAGHSASDESAGHSAPLYYDTYGLPVYYPGM